MSNCSSGRTSRLTRTQRRQRQPQRHKSLNQAGAPADKTRAAAHAAWDCFFRHLQRLPSLSTLSLQRCGLEDRDARSLSVSLQILPAGRLRCLRLNGNSVGISGLRMLLTALTSRGMRLPALWLRGQRPALLEGEAKRIVEEAFRDGLFAEVKAGGGVGRLGLDGFSRYALALRGPRCVQRHAQCHRTLGLEPPRKGRDFYSCSPSVLLVRTVVETGPPPSGPPSAPIPAARNKYSAQPCLTAAGSVSRSLQFHA